MKKNIAYFSGSTNLSRNFYEPYYNMKIFFIIIILFFLTYLIVSSILGNNIFIKLIKSIQQGLIRRRLIRCLDKLNYFSLVVKEEKGKHIKAINLYGNNRLGIQKLINRCTFLYDKRLYLIGIDIDKELLLIQKESGNDKWTEFVFNNDFANKDFLDFAYQIGLSIKVIGPIIFNGENEISSFKFMINQNSYEICFPHFKDEVLIAEFTTVLNSELTKIESENSFYLYETHPPVLFYANEKITNYLNKLNSENNKKILTPKKWQQTVLH